MECKQCSNEDKIKDHELRIKELEISRAETTKDISYFKQSLEKLNKTLEELKDVIQELSKKPLKKYEDRYEKIAFLIISNIVAFILGQVFKGF